MLKKSSSHKCLKFLKFFSQFSYKKYVYVRMYVCQSTRHEKMQHFYQRVGNKTLPLVRISQEFNFLSMPPASETFTGSKVMISIEKSQALCLGYEYREQWQKSSEKNPPLRPAPNSSIFGILRHYTQATVLINGRKSINPTILSIQIRNKLQIWPTKKIK